VPFPPSFLVLLGDVLLFCRSSEHTASIRRFRVLPPLRTCQNEARMHAVRVLHLSGYKFLARRRTALKKHLTAPEHCIHMHINVQYCTSDAFKTFFRLQRLRSPSVGTVPLRRFAHVIRMTWCTMTWCLSSTSLANVGGDEGRGSPERNPSSGASGCERIAGVSGGSRSKKYRHRETARSYIFPEP